MRGVVNLYPSRCDFQTRRSIELVSGIHIDDISVTALSLGPGGDFVNIPQAIRAMRAIGGRNSGIAHAWGPAELVVAATSGFDRIIFSPQAPVNSSWLRWIDFILRRRHVEIICPTTALRNIFLLRGVPADRCSVIFPGVDFDRLGRPDAEMRADLGFSDSDLVLLAPGESAREARHQLSLWSVGILSFLDHRYRMLCWGRGPCTDALRRFVRRRPDVMVQAEKRLRKAIDFEQLFAATQMAIVSAGTFAPTLPLLTCMAAGLPIVAIKTPASAELLEDNVTALLESSANPSRFAERVLDLQKDQALRSHLSHAARRRARERFSAARFVSDWQNVYRRLLGAEDSCATASAIAS